MATQGNHDGDRAMAGLLVLGLSEKAAIEIALKDARANIVPSEVLKDFALDDDRQPAVLGERRPGFRPRSQPIALGTYRAAVSFEEQLNGIFRHLSVSSSRNPKKGPGPDVMQKVCKAFGFSPELCKMMKTPKPNSTKRHAIWVEEFEPGHMAINVLEALLEGQ
jgi:hypothetical protein